MKTKPNIPQDYVQKVLAALSCGRWIKGRELNRHFGIPPRIVRGVAEQTGEIISSQHGYKLTCHATSAEIKAAQADLISRSRHIEQRAARLEAILWRRESSQELLI